MRSRVVIVARKSDHICVVQDVPDTRGSWYQRQQHSTQSNYSMGSQHSGGSIDQAAPPQLSTPAAPPAAAQPAATSSAGHPASAGSGATAAKPSFAALLGKHPAIKEEPTTPGGTLTSEAPPSCSAGKRSPFRKLSPVPAGAGENISQILSLLNELKTDLTRKFGDLSKRVDSMDANLGIVSQQVSSTHETSFGGRHKPAAPLAVPALSGSDPLAARASSQAPAAASSAGSRERRDSTKATEAPAESADKTKRRERSKSPHHSKHHHHHHHHRKATHPTPSATPTVSQTDLRQSSSGRADAERAPIGQEAAAGSGLARTPSGVESNKQTPAQAQAQAQAHTQTASGQPSSSRIGSSKPAGGSLEQSDDDQDATSKL